MGPEICLKTTLNWSSTIITAEELWYILQKLETEQRFAMLYSKASSNPFSMIDPPLAMSLIPVLFIKL